MLPAGIIDLSNSEQNNSPAISQQLRATTTTTGKSSDATTPTGAVRTSSVNRGGFLPGTGLGPNNNRASNISAQDVLYKLQTKYLPDLKSLHLECIWLKTNLGLENKQSGLQSNEARLLQFIQMIDTVIKKIQSFEGKDISGENPGPFLMLESNIVKTILPVRARLHEKWKENQTDSTGAAAGSGSKANGKTSQKPSSKPKKTAAVSNGTNGGKEGLPSGSLSWNPAGDGNNIHNPNNDSAPLGMNMTVSIGMGKNHGGMKQMNTLQSSVTPTAASGANKLVGGKNSKSNTKVNGVKGSSTSKGSNNQQSGQVKSNSKGSKNVKGNKIPRTASTESTSSMASWGQLTGGMGSMNIKSNPNSSAQLAGNFASLTPQQQQQHFYAQQQQQQQMMMMMMNAQQAGNFSQSSMSGMPGMGNASFTGSQQVPANHEVAMNQMNNTNVNPNVFDESSLLDSNYFLYGDDLDPSLMNLSAGEVPSAETLQAINPNPGKRSYNSAMNSMKQGGGEGGKGGGNSTVSTIVGDGKTSGKKGTGSSTTSGGNSNSTGKQDSTGKVYYRSSVDIDMNPQLNSSLGLSLGEGAVNIKEEEYMSNRRRRRLNQIVPNPRKPREADYTCSLCSEPYTMTVQENPWWAVYTHECPKCKQEQIPRIDISATNNAIELDPNIVALYGEGVEESGDEDDDDDDDEQGEFSEDEEDEEDIPSKRMEITDGALTATSGNEAIESANAEITGGEVEGGDAEQGGDNNKPQEENPFDGDGLLAQEEASKLLVLMCHARTCNGVHASEKHAEICKSTKFLMLHIRDCKGTDLHGRDCMFPWCRPCKKMLRHLTQCYNPSTCSVCNPWCLPESFQQLRKLNEQTFCQPISESPEMEVSEEGVDEGQNIATADVEAGSLSLADEKPKNDNDNIGNSGT